MYTLNINKRIVRDDPLAEPYAILDALAVDAAASTYLDQSPAQLEPLVLDLSDATNIQHECLLYLGAIMRFRHLKRRITKLELPNDSEALDFMRFWEFPEFVVSVLGGEALERILTPRSWERYKSVSAELPESIKVIDTQGGGDEQLLPRGHFVITPVNMLDNPRKAATLAHDRWLQQHIVSVLDRYLKNEGERIATTVVLEAVLNAASHPQAQMAFTSSQFVRKALPWHSEPHLEMAIWDDGNPFGTTLQRRLDLGLGIISPAFGTVEETLKIQLVRSNGKDDFRILKPRIQDLDPEFPWLTMSAFLTGVTSVPDRPDVASGGASDFGGRGLPRIRRTVIDLFGGQIRYFSGNYRMTMTAGDEPSVYDVLLQYRPSSSWNLQGNLMLVDIPTPAFTGVKAA